MRELCLVNCGSDNGTLSGNPSLGECDSINIVSDLLDLILGSLEDAVDVDEEDVSLLSENIGCCTVSSFAELSAMLNGRLELVSSSLLSLSFAGMIW